MTSSIWRDNYSDDDKGGWWKDRPALTIIIAIILVLAATVLWYLYEPGEGADSDKIPHIAAEKEPVRIKPENPGGMVTPHQDKSVYERLNKTQNAPGMEKLLPTPEEPILPAKPEVIIKEEIMPGAPSAAANTHPSRWPSQKNPLSNVDITVQAPEVIIEMPGTTSQSPQTAPATTKPVKSATPPSKTAYPSKGRDFKIQLGAFKEMHVAEREKKRLLGKNKVLLKGSPLSITKVDLKSKGIFYRIQAGGFASAKAAEARCQEFKKANTPCIIIAP